MSRRVALTLLTVSLAAILVALPASVGARTASNVLVASVGTSGAHEAFRITLTDSSGNRVIHLDPGQYTIQVHDYATLHSFHLKGPGVDRGTDVPTTGDETWDVTFVNGTYRYFCDAHAATMNGSFTVGVVPIVPKLFARVGPGATISLKNAQGQKVRAMRAGRYRVVVKDATARDNFHLYGARVNKKTGVTAKGTVTWTVVFSSGIYRYRSDAHPTLHGSFKVILPPSP